LAILGCLRHPNIIELLACFTYRNRRNLVLPLADLDLSILLRCTDRPPAFRSDETLIAALAGLSSAIEQLHDFTVDGTRIFGCHNWIVPSNILVRGKKFPLSDFGFSKLAETPEAVETKFKSATSHHLAPECESISEDDFTPGVMSRSSDIWSFGCVLAEAMTYMTLGATGVEEFKFRRKFIIHKFTRFTFHIDGRENPAVDRWLSELEKRTPETRWLLLQLIRDMLSLRLEARPTAQEVSKQLYLVALHVAVQRIDDLYTAMTKRTDEGESSTAITEQKSIFEAWKCATGLIYTPGDRTLNRRNLEARLDLKSTLSFLSPTEETLKEAVPRDLAFASILICLSELNHQLFGLLSPELRLKFDPSCAKSAQSESEDVFSSLGRASSSLTLSSMPSNPSIPMNVTEQLEIFVSDDILRPLFEEALKGEKGAERRSFESKFVLLLGKYHTDLLSQGPDDKEKKAAWLLQKRKKRFAREISERFATDKSTSSKDGLRLSSEGPDKHAEVELYLSDLSH
jgi:serine/threonine protein kinase